MVKLILCVLACFVAGSYAVTGQTCVNDGECGGDECCQILSEFMVVSKRDNLLQPTPPRAGTCQKYKLEGQYCSSFEKINGYCGCGPGLKCNTYERPLATPAPPPTLVATHLLNARGMLPPRPGYEWVSECEKI